MGVNILLSSVFEKMKERMEETVQTFTGAKGKIIKSGRKASAKKHQATQIG